MLNHPRLSNDQQTKYALFLCAELLPYQVINVLPKVEVASNSKKTAQGTSDVSPTEVGSTSKQSSDKVCCR